MQDNKHERILCLASVRRQVAAIKRRMAYQNFCGGKDVNKVAKNITKRDELF